MNIKNTIIAAIAIASISLTSAFAGMSVGVVGSVLDVSASGTETDKITAAGANIADTSTRKKSISESTPTASVYLEYTLEKAWPVSIGVEFTPGTADISNKFSRTDTEKSHSGTKLISDRKVIREAQASVTDMLTTYIEVPLFAGIYVKGGASHLTVNHTNDSLMAQSSSIGGTTFGGGWKTETDGGYIIKASYEETDYDAITLVSSGNSVAANTNTVKADMDTKAYRFSIGKAF